MTPRRLAPALPLDKYKPSNRRINLHRKHPRRPLRIKVHRLAAWESKTPALIRSAATVYIERPLVEQSAINGGGIEGKPPKRQKGDPPLPEDYAHRYGTPRSRGSSAACHQTSIFFHW
jgi:hypothetical protein